MRKLILRMLALAALLGIVVPAAAAAQATAAQAPPPPPTDPTPQAAGTPQTAPTGATFCGTPVAPPANLPPADSGPVVWVMGPCFMAQGNVSTVEAQTYLYYMQLRPSQ